MTKKTGGKNVDENDYDALNGVHKITEARTLNTGANRMDHREEDTK